MRLGVEAAVVDGEVVRGDVEVADGRVVASGLSPGGAGLAVPGLVDLQVNGWDGIDLAQADASGWLEVADALAAAGTTSFRPTLITAPEAELVAALARVPDDPRLLGVHLEGPFLSAGRIGAHPPESRRDPDAALLGRLLAAGPVAQVTLAPELPGALELVELLRARGLLVSAGHSDATAAEAHAGFDRGISTVTHLFNAMRPLHHRDPGLAGAALARDDVTVQLIADGVHVADEALLLAWRAAGGRLALVSDAIAAATPTRGDGVLRGGTATLLDGVRRLHGLGVPLAEAVAAASEVPARLAGAAGRGTLRPGARADVLVLDDRLELLRVVTA